MRRLSIPRRGLNPARAAPAEPAKHMSVSASPAKAWALSTTKIADEGGAIAAMVPAATALRKISEETMSLSIVLSSADPLSA
jgi:hypothetical protein